MIKKIMKILFITSLLFLMLGAACASEVSNDTQTDVYSHVEENLVHDTPSSTMERKTVQEEKSILKDEKNTKTSSKTYDIRDFNTLKNSLTNSTYDNVTLNINSNIKLTDNTTLHGAIKTLTINGNGKTVDGNQNRFLIIQHNTNVTIRNLTIKNCYAYNGGAIYCYNANLTIVNSSFNHNNASYGGAVYCSRSNVTIDGSILNIIFSF